MGYCNDMHGRENSLVKVRKVFDYTPPKKHAPKSKPLTKAQVKKRSVKLAEFLRKRRIFKKRKRRLNYLKKRNEREKRLENEN